MWSRLMAVALVEAISISIYHYIEDVIVCQAPDRGRTAVMEMPATVPSGSGSPAPAVAGGDGSHEWAARQRCRIGRVASPAAPETAPEG